MIRGAAPRRRATAIASTLLLAALARADAPAAVDLETWRRIGEQVWRFDPAGAEAGPAAGSGFLVSTEVYRDFELSVEFWIEDDTNSGVFVRCGNVDDVPAINPFDCYEINIYDSHPKPEARTGSIVTRAAPLARVDTLKHWTRLQVSVAGSRIEVRVNGTLTANIEDAHTAAGPIALQYAGNAFLRFRNLLITPRD